jgi:hypothetical protein
VDCSINQCKTAIRIPDPEESQVLGQLNVVNRWSNLIKTKILIPSCLINVQTEFLQEA